MNKQIRRSVLVSALAAALGTSAVYAHELDRDDAPTASAYGRAEADASLVNDVRDALARAPDIDASRINVSVDGGEAYLTGTVPTEEQTRMAHEVAHSVPGVRNVHVDRLRVVSADSDENVRTAPAVSSADEAIHDEVHEALEHTRGIDASDVHVRVHNGVVYLSGYVPNNSQRVYAHDVAHSVDGVREVHTNELRISG